jgi:NTE family protein
MIPDERLKKSPMPLRPVECMVISPSIEINKIAERHAHALPRALSLFYRGIGAMKRDGSALLSYVLFEEPFCRELIELGYQDTLPRKAEILRFIGIEARNGPEAKNTSPLV